MSSIIFDVKINEKPYGRGKNNSKVIFDFDNVFTKLRSTRIIKFHIDDAKGQMFKDDLVPYIQFMIDHNILNESTLTLAQVKMIKYMIYGYPKSYPHTKQGIPPGIGRYFHRQNYDRNCLGKDSIEEINKTMEMASRYPNRLLAPHDTGTTTLILGSSFSGKTYLLCQEIALIRPYEYDLIILFTESVNVPGLAEIRKRPDVILKEGFDPAIPSFLKRLNSKLGLRYKFLLILDDIISEKSSRKSILGKMITIYRNSNISTCVLLQYPTLIEKHCRSNFHQFVCTGMRSPESNKSMSDRFDIMSWAKDRIKKDRDQNGMTGGLKVSNDETYSYLKKLLMKDGVVMYIDLKKSLDPSVIDLNS